MGKVLSDVFEKRKDPQKRVIEEQPEDEVKEMILNVLREATGERGFVPPGIFYREIKRQGYTGSQERLNSMAEEMEEVDGAKRGMSQNVHYRLRRK